MLLHAGVIRMGMMVVFNPNSHYAVFLQAFGNTHSFQTFDDKGKNKSLVKQFHGNIESFIDELSWLNKRGAGVYFTVNQTDLKGRTTANVNRVRSVFIDLDGAPLPEKFDLEPHFILETSPKKYHVYWLVDEMPLPTFTLYQQALAKKFNSDDKVKDLPRVMRVAGFYHNKREPYPIKIRHMIDPTPYDMDEIRDQLGLQRPQPRKFVARAPVTFQGAYAGNKPYGASGGDRHERLVAMIISIRKRGESIEYATEEAIKFADACQPPESRSEAVFQVRDIYNRY